MKKYTIVYSVYIGNGHYVTEFERVETDLATLLNNYDAWFVFEGWPELDESWRDVAS